MNKYTEANKRLAAAKGWTDIVEVGGALLGTPPDGAPGSRGQAMIPDWCGDWRECGPLQVGINIEWERSRGQQSRVTATWLYGARYALLRDHNSRCNAVRYVIVGVKTDELEVAQ